MNKLVLYSLILLLFTSHLMQAQWEPTAFNQSTWILCQTENGNLLATNDVYPEMGGIYISQDQGITWTDTQVEKSSYTGFSVTNQSVYMGGVGSNVAISHDNGATCTISNHSDLFPGAHTVDPIYAIERHNIKIRGALLSHGIVYSDDQGETWQLTDIDSLLDPDKPENGGLWGYHLRSYSGRLSSIGAFGICEWSE